MDITITGRHGAVEDTVKTYIHERLQKILRLSDRLSSAQVILDNAQGGHRVEVVIAAPKGSRFVAHAEGADIRSVFDVVGQKLEAQIRNWKDRLVDHRPN